MARLYPHFQLSERLGAKVLDVDARTVGELLESGPARYGPEFAKEVEALTILVNGRNIRYLGGTKTPLGPEDEVFFVRGAAGG